MARFFEIFFDVDRIVAKGRASFRTCRRKCDRKLFRAAGDLHATTTAAGRSLDDDRIADFLGDTGCFDFIRHAAVRTRNDRDAEALCGALGFDLVAHDADMRSSGADEGNVMGFKDFGEFCIFRKEAVAGVNCIRAGDFAGGHDLMDVQIAVA